MKKVLALIVSLVLLASLAHAQTARNVLPRTYGNVRTNTANIAANGLEQEGNPGYIALQGVAASPSAVEWYLWVDDTGDLCIASYETIAAYASFPNGNWRSNHMTAACGKVGGQS